MHATPPFLGLVASPLGLLVLVAVVVGAATRGRDLGSRAQRQPLALLLVALALYVPAGWYYGQRLHASGDEPHYLLMAQSLARSGDLDLRDEFARGDYREYTPELAAPHYGAPRADGRPFPAHSPGLPLLLAPVYALMGRAGCLALMGLLAALLGVQIHALALHASGSPGAALWAWAATLGAPLAFYTLHVYTEVPSALALALALRLLLTTTGPGSAVGAALCVTSLPWLHVKMVPVAALVGLWVLLRERGARRAWFLGIATLGALGFLAYYQIIFGQASPLALYGGGVPHDVQLTPLRALVGLLWDRSFGLLPYAPIFVLALAGLPLAVTRAFGRDLTPSRAALQLHLAVLVAVLAPALMWRMWWGGQCPPGRFLVPALPALGVLLALRLSSAPERGLARLRRTLLAFGLLLAVVLAAQPAERLLLNRRERPTRAWEALAGAVSMGRYLPSLVYSQSGEARVAGLWMAFLLAALVADARARRAPGREARGRIGASHALTGMALLLVLAAIDGWARRPPVEGSAKEGAAGGEADAAVP